MFFRLPRLVFFTTLACLSGFQGQGVAQAAAGAPDSGRVTFDDLEAGSSPAGWEATQTGIGTAHWTVEKDVSAPSPTQVLKQSGEAQFPVCIYQKATLNDGFVEVKFKPVSGKEDQAGGLVFRAQDKDNYYVVRANALEDTVELFHTLHSHRESVKAAEVKVAGQQWHTLRAEFRGPHITVYYDGKRVLEVEDTALTDAGKVGVWTKSDSVTLFDDFCFGGLKRATSGKTWPGCLRGWLRGFPHPDCT